MGWPLDGVLLFVNYLLSLWDFRKLYMEGPEFNFVRFASAFGRYLVEEGRLRAHDYHDGRYWDSITAAVYRETWEGEGRRFLRGVLPAGRSDVPAV